MLNPFLQVLLPIEFLAQNQAFEITRLYFIHLFEANLVIFVTIYLIHLSKFLIDVLKNPFCPFIGEVGHSICLFTLRYCYLRSALEYNRLLKCTFYDLRGHFYMQVVSVDASAPNIKFLKFAILERFYLTNLHLQSVN